MLLCDSLLVAAIGAPTVTLMHLWFGYRNTRRMAQFNAELERQNSRLTSSLERDRQFSAEYLHQYLDYVVQGRETRLTAFRDLSMHVQLARDQLRLVVADPDAFDGKVLSDELQDISAKIAHSYATFQLQLGEQDRALAHTLKNHCVDVQTKVRSSLADSKPAQIAPIMDARKDDIAEIEALQFRLRERATEVARVVAESLREKAMSEGRDDSTNNRA